MINYEDESARLPCPLCKKDGAPTVAGDHFKCLTCDHVWNPDGRELEFECWCKTCAPQQEGGKSMEDLSKASKKKGKEKGD